MGSTALISHLQPNCCFHRLDSTRTLNFLQKPGTSTSKSGFLRISDRPKKSKVRCFAAVEGEKEQKQQVLSTVGSAVEERLQLGEVFRIICKTPFVISVQLCLLLYSILMLLWVFTDLGYVCFGVFDMGLGFFEMGSLQKFLLFLFWVGWFY